jgi:hypothetical protein
MVRRASSDFLALSSYTNFSHILPSLKRFSEGHQNRGDAAFQSPFAIRYNVLLFRALSITANLFFASIHSFTFIMVWTLMAFSHSSSSHSSSCRVNS